MWGNADGIVVVLRNAPHDDVHLVSANEFSGSLSLVYHWRRPTFLIVLEERPQCNAERKGLADLLNTVAEV